jgi:hypothetical protein
MNELEDSKFEFNLVFTISKEYLNIINRNRTEEDKITWEKFTSKMNIAKMHENMRKMCDSAIKAECDLALDYFVMF